MARAYGTRAQLLGKFRTGGSYGDTPVGDYIKLPFISCDLGGEQGLVASNVLGHGREPQKPDQDVINVNGNVVVPVDDIHFGYWLRLLLGDPQTAGAAAPYTHTFTSGADALPDMALEVGMPEVPAFYTNAGVVANSMQLEFVRAGGPQGTFAVIGQKEVRNPASQGGEPTEAQYRRFSGFLGAVKRNGAALGNVTRATLTFANGTEAVENLRGDGLIDGADPGAIALSGEIVVRFADTVLEDDASNGTPCELELGWVQDANTSLLFTLHEVYLPKPKKSISGPGGIQATFAYQGAQNPVGGKSMTAVLKNAIASYTA